MHVCGVFFISYLWFVSESHYFWYSQPHQEDVMERQLVVESIVSCFHHKVQPFLLRIYLSYKLYGVFMKNLVINLYGIMGWNDPNYHVECNGTPFQKSHM